MGPAPLALCPETLFPLVDDCPHTEPLPHHARRHWPAAAHLLEWLLTHDITDWTALNLETLDALYEATVGYPTDEDWSEADPDDPEPTVDEAMMLANPWHLVLGEGGLPISYTRLPIVPVWTHPFY